MSDDEHVHMLGAKNGWVDCSTHLLLLAAGSRGFFGQPRRRACKLAILACYYVCALGRSEENLPGCSLEAAFAVAADAAEGGGEATLASFWDALEARERLLEAWEWSWVITLGFGVA